MSTTFQPPFHRYVVRVLEGNAAGKVHEVQVLAQNVCNAEAVALDMIAVSERINPRTLTVTYVCLDRLT